MKRTVFALVYSLLAVASFDNRGAAVQAQPALVQCLRNTESRVVVPGDPGYDPARQVVNRRIPSPLPIAVTYPSGPAAVSGIVRCCSADSTQLSIRAGGHSYEGYSTLNNSVVLDLTEGFNYYRKAGNDCVVVGGGIKLGPLYYQAWLDGFAFPGGVCPAVGLAGLAMGGGWGLLSHKYGMACDHIAGVQMIDARGDLIIADANENSDLFWATRGGGGGNFGVVTELTLQMAIAPQITTDFRLIWDLASFQQIFEGWQKFAPAAPDELTIQLEMDTAQEVFLNGLYLGNKVDCNALLQSSGLLDVPGFKRIQYYDENTFIDHLLNKADLTQGIKPDAPINLSLPPNTTLKPTDPFKAKSLDVVEPLSAQAMQMIHDALAADPTGPSGFVQFNAYGGAINRVPADGTAFARRNLLYSMQIFVNWDDPSKQAASLAWIDGLYAKLVPLVNGGQQLLYLNYIDADILEWETAYYGPALPRLQAVKAKYDPTNFFRGPQSITLPTNG